MFRRPPPPPPPPPTLQDTARKYLDDFVDYVLAVDSATALVTALYGVAILFMTGFLVESYARQRISFGKSWSARLETLAVASFSLYSLGPLIITSLLLVVFCIGYSNMSCCMVSAYMLWMLFLDSSATSGARNLRSLRTARWWHYYADFFPITLVKTHELDPSQRYVFGYHPHGIISVGAISAFGTEGARTLDVSGRWDSGHRASTKQRGFSTLFRGLRPNLVTLPINFRLPCLRELFLSLGAVNSSVRTFRSVLSRGAGTVLVVVVGGAEESMHVVEGGMQLVLERRKGFVREAISAGACLVPVLAYGENDLYRIHGELAPDSPFAKLTGFVRKYLGFAIPRFSGRTMLFKSGGLMPLRTPVTVVVGKPLPPPPRPDPSEPFVPVFDKADKTRPLNEDARVLDAHHKQYVALLKDLYQTTKNVPWNTPGLNRIESLRILK